MSTKREKRRRRLAAIGLRRETIDDLEEIAAMQPALQPALTVEQLVCAWIENDVARRKNLDRRTYSRVQVSSESESTVTVEGTSGYHGDA